MAAYIGTSKDITTERHLPLRPGGDVAPPFPTFTDEETAVLRALINAHAEAARERARLVDGLVRVTAIGNSIAYDDAKSVIAVASRRSEALMLAIELAGWTFNQRAIERSDRLNVEPFENTPSFAGGDGNRTTVVSAMVVYAAVQSIQTVAGSKPANTIRIKDGKVSLRQGGAYRATATLSGATSYPSPFAVSTAAARNVSSPAS